MFPLSQHIGEAADPLVEVGDSILKGQPIARSLSYISAPVHAPTSGRIIDIGAYPIPHPSGLKADCIVIEADGEDLAAPSGLRWKLYLRPIRLISGNASAMRVSSAWVAPAFRLR